MGGVQVRRGQWLQRSAHPVRLLRDPRFAADLAAFTGNTAEWIMEAPDFGEPISSLPKFSQVQFTGAQCSGPGGASSDPSQGDVWTVSGFGKTLTAVTLATDEVTVDFTG